MEERGQEKQWSLSQSLKLLPWTKASSAQVSSVRAQGEIKATRTVCFLLMPRPRPLQTLVVTTNAAGRRTGSPEPAPTSPTFSEVTNASAINFGENGPAKIITRADLKVSMQAYDSVSAF